MKRELLTLLVALCFALFVQADPPSDSVVVSRVLPGQKTLIVKGKNGGELPPIRLSDGVTLVGSDGKVIPIEKFQPGDRVMLFYKPDEKRPVVTKVMRLER